MSARRVDLPEIKRGTDWAVTFRLWTDKAKTTAGEWAGTSYVAEIVDASEGVHAVDVDTSNADDGLLVLSLDPVATTALPPGALEWTLTQTAPKIVELLEGRVPVSREAFGA